MTPKARKDWLDQVEQMAQALTRVVEEHVSVKQLLGVLQAGYLRVSLPDGQIVAANPRACEIFGYTELAGLSLLALLPEDSRENHVRYLEEFSQSRTSRLMGRGGVVTGVRRDGATVSLLCAVLTLESDPAFAGVLLIALPHVEPKLSGPAYI